MDDITIDTQPRATVVTVPIVVNVPPGRDGERGERGPPGEQGPIGDTGPEGQPGPGTEGRLLLQNDKTYFVATTGNDTNPGTFTAPFKTIQKAVMVGTQDVDSRAYKLGIQLANGTYNENVFVKGSLVGGMELQISGNGPDPSLVVIASPGPDACFTLASGAVLSINSCTVTNPNGFCFTVVDRSDLQLEKMVFGDAQGHINLTAYSRVFATNLGYTITAIQAGFNHMTLESGSVAYINTNIDIPNPLTYTYFLLCQTGSTALFEGMTFTGAGVAGTVGIRYLATDNSYIGTGGNGVNFLPGSVPGSVDVTSMYDGNLGGVAGPFLPLAGGVMAGDIQTFTLSYADASPLLDAAKTLFYGDGSTFVDAGPNLYYPVINQPLASADAQGGIIWGPDGNAFVDMNGPSVTGLTEWYVGGAATPHADTDINGNPRHWWPNGQIMAESPVSPLDMLIYFGDGVTIWSRGNGGNQSVNWTSGNQFMGLGSAQEPGSVCLFTPDGIDTLIGNSGAIYIHDDLIDNVGASSLVGQPLVGPGGGGAVWGNVDWSYVASTPTTLAGYGITDAAPLVGPGVVARVPLTGQVASIGTTAMWTPPVDGEYVVEGILTATTAGAAGTVLVTITWTDENGAQTFSTAALVLTGLANLTFSLPIHARTTGAISYATTVVGNIGGVYSLYINLVRRF